MACQRAPGAGRVTSTGPAARVRSGEVEVEDRFTGGARKIECAAVALRLPATSDHSACDLRAGDCGTRAHIEAVLEAAERARRRHRG